MTVSGHYHKRGPMCVSCNVSDSNNRIKEGYMGTTITVMPVCVAMAFAHVSAAGISDGGGDQGASAGTKQLGESARGRSMEEIIVSAQRREERLEEVPISISVVTGEQLDSSTLTSLKDTLDRIPGIATMQPSLSNPTIVVRGVASAFGATGGTVGYYVDSVPFGFARFGFYPDMNLYDLARLEVLRGPQGTLYGANSLSGVIRLLTKDPELNRFEAKTRASIATIEDGGENYRADATLNIPIVEDRLAMRLTGGYDELGGWVDKPNGKDANASDVKTLRAKLKAKPTDALTLDAVAWSSRRSGGAQNIGREDRTTSAPLNEPWDSDFDTYAVTAAYEFTGMSLTSATSYIDFAIDSKFSIDLFLPGVLSRGEVFAKVFSEELTLQSTGGEPWQWSIGVMYRDAEDRFRNSLIGAGLITPVINFDDGNQSKSVAIFGETTRNLLNGKVEATLGLRYYRDEFSSEQHFRAGGLPLLSAEDTSDAVTPRAVLAWHPTDGSTLYASYAQGFRGGLTQDPTILGDPAFPASGLKTVKPDKLSNYEIGAKGALFDRRLSLEGALYYMDWQDIKVQFSPLPPPSLLSGLVNGAGASGVGVDTAFTFRPVSALQIGGSVSWNDLTYDADVFAQSGGGLLSAKGDRIGGSPETTANGFVELSIPLRGLTGRLSGSVNYMSSWESGNGSTDSITTISSRFTIESPSGWAASLFGDNLTDENGITFPQPFDIWTARNPPRTVGLQLEYSF
jgi:iron complex outermembrane recepter protein